MIAIIGALEEEVKALCLQMEDYEIKEISGVEIRIGTLAGKEVVLMKSGVGKGFAAMSTTILLEHFSITHIINIGTAGGLLKDQNVLDIVVSKLVVQHDFDTSALDGDSGKGMYFEADDQLNKLCEEVLSGNEYQVWNGLIASGDAFIAGEERLFSLLQNYPNAFCAEMEAGAIAQVATHYQIPFVIIRSLSDVATNPNSHIDFPIYLKEASIRSAAFTKEIVSKL